MVGFIDVSSFSASMHLEHLKVCSEPLWWFRYQKMKGSINTWSEPCTLVIYKFNPDGNQPRNMSKFAKIQQKSSVKEYMEDFEDLSNHIHGFNMEFNVETFIIELKDDLGMKLHLSKHGPHAGRKTCF